MKHATKTIVASLLLSAAAHSDEAPPITDPLKIMDDKVQIMPEVFSYFASGRYIDEKNSIDINTTAIFGGLRLSFDNVRPMTIYYGSSALIALGGSKHSYTSIPKERDEEPTTTSWSVHQSSLYSNIEQRVGYSFHSKKTMLTPLIGVGLNYVKPQVKEKNSYIQWIYGTTGINITHTFSENLTLDFSIKALHILRGNTKFPAKTGPIKTKMKKTWGYEAAAPVSWQLSVSKKWSLRIHPYLIKYNLRSDERIIGFRFQLRHSF